MADRKGLIHHDRDMRPGCSGWLPAFCSAPLRNYLDHQREGEVAEAGWRAYLPAFCRLPLHEHAVAKVVDLLSHVFVVASGTAAPYLLAGGKRGSACYPSVDGPLPLSYQAMVACLPIITFPLAVVLGGQLKTYIDQGAPVQAGIHHKPPADFCGSVSSFLVHGVFHLHEHQGSAHRMCVPGTHRGACLGLQLGYAERLMPCLGRGNDAGEQ